MSNGLLLKMIPISIVFVKINESMILCFFHTFAGYFRNTSENITNEVPNNNKRATKHNRTVFYIFYLYIPAFAVFDS